MTAPVLPANSPDAIARAATILREGGLVGMPTETVYGLAADANNAAAVARLYAAKGRPRFNPLIAHVTDAEMARTLVEWPGMAAELATAFWPGPLTLVLPKLNAAPICDLANAGLDSVAIRAPGHASARALLAAFGGPLVAPSANPSARRRRSRRCAGQPGHAGEPLCAARRDAAQCAQRRVRRSPARFRRDCG